MVIGKGDIGSGGLGFWPLEPITYLIRLVLGV